MKLSINNLKNKQVWQEKGYKLPEFDVKKVKENTLKDPMWLHFGAGNVFRAFPAALQQTLLNKGFSDKGIIVCSYDEEIIEKAYTPFENLSLLVTLKPDGSMDKKVVASVVHAISAKDNIDELESIFTSSSLQMVSFTITEKGYSLTDSKGEYFPSMLNEFENLDKVPKSLMGC